MIIKQPYTIHENFLSKQNYSELKEFLYGQQISWYHRTYDSPKNLLANKNGFFSFCWYNDMRPDHPLFDKHILPILNQLNAFIPVQVRANLVHRDVDTKESDWHNDYYKDEVKTAILYFTTCNAKTLLNIDEKEIVPIDSIENRIVIFPSKTKHKVIYQTDVHKRIVINFNFI